MARPGPAGETAATMDADLRSTGVARRVRKSRARTAAADRAVLFALAAFALGLVGLGLLPAVLDLGGEGAEPGATAPIERPATAAEVERALTLAAAALERGDRQAWREALPADGAPAREATRELFRRLSPLPWSGVAVHLLRIEGRPGRFNVRLTGRLGAAGPSDRLMADRVLDFRRLGDRTVVVDDITPEAAARQHFMAFNRPVVVKGEGCLVVADRSWRPRARLMAELSGAAHAKLDALRLAPGRTTLILVFGSRGQIGRYRGAPFPDDRIRFFSAASPRLADTEWWPRDIGVLAPALADVGDWATPMLAHELTHAYTMRWFADTAHSPPLLLEGLAVAVEGGRTYDALREELASGNQTFPLTTALATASLWMGSGIERVHLGYLMGGSLVLYVLDEWGLATLRDFVRGVSDSDLTPDGLDAAVRDSLGVGWDQFIAGWKSFVWTLP